MQSRGFDKAESRKAEWDEQREPRNAKNEKKLRRVGDLHREEACHREILARRGQFGLEEGNTELRARGKLGAARAFRKRYKSWRKKAEKGGGGGGGGFNRGGGGAVAGGGGGVGGGGGGGCGGGGGG